jgi:hypothetical protein
LVWTRSRSTDPDDWAGRTACPDHHDTGAAGSQRPRMSGASLWPPKSSDSIPTPVLACCAE